MARPSVDGLGPRLAPNSGDGTVLPLVAILSGALHQRQWYTTTEIPDDTLIALSDTGYLNNDISLE